MEARRQRKLIEALPTGRRKEQRAYLCWESENVVMPSTVEVHVPSGSENPLHAHARLVDTDVVCVLARFRVALDGNRSQRKIRRLHWQPGEAHAEVILRKGDRLAGLYQLCRIYLGQQAGDGHIASRPERHVHIERLVLARESGVAGAPHRADVAVEDGVAVGFKPLSHLAKRMNAGFGDGAVRLGSDIEQVI